MAATTHERTNFFVLLYYQIIVERTNFFYTFILSKNIVNLLFIAETKVDNTFVDAQIMVDNNLIWRADRNEHGGGVAAYLRSDIAGKRKCDYEFQKNRIYNNRGKTQQYKMAV